MFCHNHYSFVILHVFLLIISFGLFIHEKSVNPLRSRREHIHSGLSSRILNTDWLPFVTFAPTYTLLTCKLCITHTLLLLVDDQTITHYTLSKITLSTLNRYAVSLLFVNPSSYSYQPFVVSRSVVVLLPSRTWSSYFLHKEPHPV